MILKLPKINTKDLYLGYIGLIGILLVLILLSETAKLTSNVKQLNSETLKKESLLNNFHRVNLEYLKVSSSSALRKNQGVNVSTVEASLGNVKVQILDGNYASASATLTQLDQAIESLYQEKLASDKLASEEARKKIEAAAAAAKKAADLAAAQKKSQAQSQTTTFVTTDPNSLGFGFSKLTLNTKNGTFSANVIKVNLASSQVFIDSANDNDCADNCPTMPLADYVSRDGGVYGMNGTYFCPPDYASCAGKVGSYDFPIFNSRVGHWINQGNLYWSNRAMMTFQGGSASFYPNASSGPTAGFGAAIVCSPGLVSGGQDIVGQYQLTSAQTTKGSRGGLGIKGSTLFMVLASGASVPDLAAIFQALGVDSALNIDGGGSSAMWAGGYRVGPGRLLPNAIIIK